MLAEIDEKVQHILALIFENYKSLDESCFSGIKHVFEPPTGTPAPAITSAIKLYGLLNNLLSQEAQLSLCRYFQVSNTHTYTQSLYLLAPIVYSDALLYGITGCFKEKIKNILLRNK